MTQTIRIPKAELSGVQGSLLKMAIRKKIGRVPDNVAVMWNHPAVFKDLMRAGARTEKWDRLDANLASFAVMAAAARGRVPADVLDVDGPPARRRPARRDRSGAARAWTSTTSWLTTGGWRWRRRARCRGGARPRRSPRWSGG